MANGIKQMLTSNQRFFSLEVVHGSGAGQNQYQDQNKTVESTHLFDIDEYPRSSFKLGNKGL